MKRLFLTCGVAAVLLGSGAQARPIQEAASFNLTVDFDQTVTTGPFTDVEQAAVAEAQTTSGQTDCGACGPVDNLIQGDATTNGVEGVVTTDQAGGTGDAQDSLLSLAPLPGAPPATPGTGAGSAQATATGSQTNSGNDAQATGLTASDATIASAFEDDRDFVFANQASGDNDNQLNLLAIAFSARPQGLAMAESELDQVNSGNRVEASALIAPGAAGVFSNATITASFNHITGDVLVNQTSGSNNNQANVMSLATVGLRAPSL